MTIGNWIINSEKREGRLAVEYKKDRQWLRLNWPDYVQKIISAYASLKSKGLKEKAHTGLMCSTRWEWAALDLALLGSQHVVVPMYPNLSDTELAFIVEHSDIELLIYETNAHAQQLERIRSTLTRAVQLVSLDEISFESAVDIKIKMEFFELCRAIQPQQAATIVYTSGTTGTPKGAVLLHEAIVSEVTEGFALFGVSADYKALTFLPYAHVLGRIEHWGSCYNGHALAYAESIEKIKSNLLDVKPDFLIAVPRIFEKVYSGIMAEVETKSYKQKIFSLALETAQELQRYRRTKEVIPWPLLLKYEGLSQLAFAPIRAAFGGQLKFAVSGGAPISESLVNFFEACGIPILEGYGLTETCAAVCVNSFSHRQAGTVGRPIGDVELKFADDGEILVRSRKCLKEYYKNPEETAKTIVDSFFSTGDIGHLTESGFLKITDRKKDLIKTAGGKYVAPQKLEGLLKTDPLISQVLIHGDQKKFIVALITFDEAQLKNWAQSMNINADQLTELYQSPVLRARLQKHIRDLNSKLSNFEAIKKFEIITDSWTTENGSLTPSLKVKRKYLEARYADLIKELYE